MAVPQLDLELQVQVDWLPSSIPSLLLRDLRGLRLDGVNEVIAPFDCPPCSKRLTSTPNVSLSKLVFRIRARSQTTVLIRSACRQKVPSIASWARRSSCRFAAIMRRREQGKRYGRRRPASLSSCFGAHRARATPPGTFIVVSSCMVCRSA